MRYHADNQAFLTTGLLRVNNAYCLVLTMGIVSA